MNRLRHLLTNYILFVKKGRNTIIIKIETKVFFKHAEYVQKTSKIWFKNVVYLERLYEYTLLNEVKDYVLQNEDIYMPDYVVKKPLNNQSNFLIYGLKVNFLGITKSKLHSFYNQQKTFLLQGQK